MNNATLETLALFKGDTIICKGKKRKDTVLIVLTDENVEEGKIQLNKGETKVHPSSLAWAVLLSSTVPSRKEQPASQAWRCHDSASVPRYQIRKACASAPFR